jgi:hypothetical protein
VITATAMRGSRVEIVECGDDDLMSDDPPSAAPGIGERCAQGKADGRGGSSELIEELAKVRMQLRKSQQARSRLQAHTSVWTDFLNC